MDGRIERAEFETMPIFNIQIPKALEGIPDGILHPRAAWADKEEYDQTARRLGEMFVKNFKNFTDTETGKALADAGPKP